VAGSGDGDRVQGLAKPLIHGLRRLAFAMAAGLVLLGSAVAAHAAAPLETKLVHRDSAAGPVEIGVTVRGRGPLVVLTPSLGRGASDFDDLSRRLADAGYRVAAIDPRGIGASRGPKEGLTLWDYADDLAAVVHALSPRPAVIVGHAFGNRVARATAVRHPELVSRLVLLAAGGQVAPTPEVSRALNGVFDPGLSPQAHLQAVRTAFFAAGNDPSVWTEGWYGAVAASQSAAGRRTPNDGWASGGAVPILIIQGAEDAVAPPANATALARDYPGRVTIVIQPGAGHAMLPERPKAIADQLIGYINARSGGLRPTGTTN
jgi:pimeloyl-ACP methyl ester carboxylesterase